MAAGWGRRDVAHNRSLHDPDAITKVEFAKGNSYYKNVSATLDTNDIRALDWITCAGNAISFVAVCAGARKAADCITASGFRVATAIVHRTLVDICVTTR